MLLSLISAVALAASPTPADQRIAERAILKPADAPRMWTVGKPNDGPVAPCPALIAARSKASGVARSRVFKNGNTFDASNTVYVYSGAAAAKRHFRALSSAATTRCYADVLVRARPDADLDVVKVEDAPLKVRRVGDQRAGTRFTVTVATEGIELEVHIDLIFVRADRGLTLLFGVGALFPFDELPRHELTAAATRRLETALSRRPPARRADRAAVASGG